MKTETEKSTTNLTRVRIAVLGKVNVGKSALTVRFLTRRYIGEYRSNTDLLYRQTVTINNTPLEVEIIDVSGETRDCILPEEQVQWSDGCIIVYSITDRDSFNYALDTLENLHKMRSSIQIPITLLGNKADLEHLRKVDVKEGRNIAAQYGCQFYEASVAENSNELYQAFEAIMNELKCTSSNNTNGIGRLRKFSVTKMIGTLIGKESNKNHQHMQGGTVMVIQRSDLHKSRDTK
ncbi:ras-related and estrogen-regulated growth inhibitor-like [Planococcus citri]|uniref:ras-related and estrogen-regulated growth inhibitor-like n=1 Tax=Planococcus citri TaxID=170843 RepID=UPI0031F72341